MNKKTIALFSLLTLSGSIHANDTDSYYSKAANELDNLGNTPLMILIMKRHQYIYTYEDLNSAALYIKWGANLNTKNIFGKTALDLCREDSDMYLLLRAYQAKTAAELAQEEILAKDKQEAQAPVQETPATE